MKLISRRGKSNASEAGRKEGWKLCAPEAGEKSGNIGLFVIVTISNIQLNTYSYCQLINNF